MKLETSLNCHIFTFENKHLGFLECHHIFCRCAPGNCRNREENVNLYICINVYSFHFGFLSFRPDRIRY